MKQLLSRLLLILAIISFGSVPAAAQNTTLTQELNARGVKPLTSANITAAGGDTVARADAVTVARLQRILRAFNRAAISNPRTAAASPITTFDGTPGTTIPTWATYGFGLGNASRNFYHVVGGIFDNADTPYSAITNAGGSKTVSVMRTDFNMTGNRVALRLKGSSWPYRFLVDGRYVTTGNFNNAFYTANSSGVHYVVLTFSTYGKHQVMVEGMAGGTLVGAYTDTIGRFFPVDLSEAVHVSAITDSYGESNVWPAADASNPLGGNYEDSIFQQLGDLEGAYMTVSAVGGTGFNHQSNGLLRLDQRMVAGDLNLAYYKPDVIYTICSVNDAYSGQNYTTVQTNAATGLAALRTQNPGVPIIMVGNNSTPFLRGDADNLAAENACIAGMNSLNDPLMAFIPNRTDPNGAWTTGTGGEIAFNAALSGATSGTLATPWLRNSGTYTVLFSDGSTRSISFTQNSAAVSWTGAVTATQDARFYSGTPGSSIYLLTSDMSHPSRNGAAEYAKRILAGTQVAIRSMYQRLLGAPTPISLNIDLPRLPTNDNAKQEFAA